MNVNIVALAGTGDRGGWFPGATARAVDTFAVKFHPFADLSQNVNLARFDAAVRHRTDIEEKIPVTAGRAREDADDFRGGLDFVVGPPRPLCAERHAGFPRALVVVAAD